jgi:hypothetical protein
MISNIYEGWCDGFQNILILSVNIDHIKPELLILRVNFDVSLTVHHTIDLFHLQTLMHNPFTH